MVVYMCTIYVFNVCICVLYKASITCYSYIGLRVSSLLIWSKQSEGCFQIHYIFCCRKVVYVINHFLTYLLLKYKDSHGRYQFFILLFKMVLMDNFCTLLGYPFISFHCDVIIPKLYLDKLRSIKKTVYRRILPDTGYRVRHSFHPQKRDTKRRKKTGKIWWVRAATRRRRSRQWDVWIWLWLLAYYVTR